MTKFYGLKNSKNSFFSNCFLLINKKLIDKKLYYFSIEKKFDKKLYYFSFKKNLDYFSFLEKIVSFILSNFIFYNVSKYVYNM